MNSLLANFESERALQHALVSLRSVPLQSLQTYTPRPLEEAPRSSVLPLCMFIAGMLGLCGFFGLMSYADVYAYPLDVGGRPAFAWPAFVPIAFELAALCAMATGFIGFFVVCRLPKPYEPIDECDHFREASRDGWCVAVRCRGAADLVQMRALLQSLHPLYLQDFLA